MAFPLCFYDGLKQWVKWQPHCTSIPNDCTGRMNLWGAAAAPAYWQRPAWLNYVIVSVWVWCKLPYFFPMAALSVWTPVSWVSLVHSEGCCYSAWLKTPKVKSKILIDSTDGKSTVSRPHRYVLCLPPPNLVSLQRRPLSVRLVQANKNTTPAQGWPYTHSPVSCSFLPFEHHKPMHGYSKVSATVVNWASLRKACIGWHLYRCKQAFSMNMKWGLCFIFQVRLQNTHKLLALWVCMQASSPFQEARGWEMQNGFAFSTNNLGHLHGASSLFFFLRCLATVIKGHHTQRAHVNQSRDCTGWGMENNIPALTLSLFNPTELKQNSNHSEGHQP